MPPLASPETRPSRRERRKADTRRRLLAAARRLFVERGYDGTRPQDVARSADVAVGTFYLHFTDKRALFLAFSDEVADELLAFLHSRVAQATGFEQRLHRCLEALFAYSDANPGLLRATAADAAVAAAHLPPHAGVRARLADDLAERLGAGVSRGEVPREYDTRLVAHGVIGFIHHALVYAMEERPDRELLLADLKRFLSRALVAEPS
jgi:AcrR family transcriptional regulator